MAAALSSCAILGSLAVEWKSIKGKNDSEGTPETKEANLDESKSEA
jgi:hypothetical protein